MPELPEVETVRRVLLATIPRSPIQDIRILTSKIIQNVTPDEFRMRLMGEVLEDIHRRGKYLILLFTHEVLISHLRMEGRYQFEEHLEPTKHDHLLFMWHEGVLAYHDTRKFGTMHLFRREDNIWMMNPLQKLGPEPMDEIMSVSYLKKCFQKRKRAIKSTLLDQTIMSGLGNIYVDEVLFRARIHPMKPASSLNDHEIAQIISHSSSVLQEAIACGGTTIRTFAIGTIHGRFQHELQIHGKSECPICHTPIQKIVVGGRGTYHCKNCQCIDKSPSL